MIETVAYLGPQGTFTHEAAMTLFPEPATELVAYPSIPDVLTAVDRGVSDIAVVPVENAIEGSVNSTLDWLVHHVDVPIIGELVYPITHCLLVHPLQAKCEKAEFTRIYSHPQAIAQCQLYLRKEHPGAELVYTESTAKAAEIIHKNPDHPWLAIGTGRAAELNELYILKKEIQDHPNNYTRFIAAGKQKKVWNQSTDLFKTSLQVTLPSDYPGALYQVLAAFSWRKINLCHIESRPTKTGLGNYYFLIDTEFPDEHVLMQGAVAEIEALGCQVRILGSYPCFNKKRMKTVIER
ncbi:prephenate dehydratase [Paenactinomyces guangxiensis]|uniref:Prephenate dehydratase n=1 Tax=Paenactinomyces guangxiensis TaxID=1490290 RepID=A0A7W1WUB9_9BACL|nr:prephenate dehydratase [Paenactinomyces guangxiensis]MBA4496177.1 prephenate dehydratase [Paenactinomyces guangxiensis]MBH8593266.1 prephenate dehydratase [Paenactinomyces guangxiensis]